MLHRALFGSLERFTGILIEQYAGRMPSWLAPVQLVVASITDSANDYAQQVVDAAREMGLRAESDLRNETISYKGASTASGQFPISWRAADARPRPAPSPCAGLARTSSR